MIHYSPAQSQSHAFHFKHWYSDEFYRLYSNKEILLEGIIIDIHHDTVWVDFGLKTVCMFKYKELANNIVSPLEAIIIRGARIWMTFEQHDPFEWKPLLNANAPYHALKCAYLWDYLEQNKFVSGRILNQVNGGFSVGIAGFVGFLPRNQRGDISSNTIGDLKIFQILKVNRQATNIIISRSSAMDSLKQLNIGEHSESDIDKDHKD